MSIIRLLTFYSLLLVFSGAEAATITWTNGSADGLWSTPGNWDLGLPVAGDDVVFDGTSSTPCAIDLSISVTSISINAGYNSIVTQNAGFTITVSGAFTQNAGTFTGGNSNITATTLNIQAGTFTSTSATLRTRNTTLNPVGTFNHNSGSALFSAGGNFTMNGLIAYNNLQINSTANISTVMGAGTVLTVTGTFTFSGTGRNNLNVGTIDCQGNVMISQTHTANNSTGTLQLSGANNQTITSVVTSGQGELPNFVVNKTGGTATFSGVFSFSEGYTHTAGTVDYITNSTTAVFAHGTCTISGTFSFFNLFFNAVNNTTYTISNDVTVQGLFRTQNTNRCNINTGRLLCEGNVTINNTNAGNQGSGTIELSGANNQAIVSTATLGRGELPNIIVNKSGGTATFTGILSTTGNWTYTAGLTDYSSNNATIGFTLTNQTVSGAQTFENIRVHHSSGGDWDVADDITVNGIFTVSGTQRTDIDGPGIVNAVGNIFISNTSTANSGTGTINISGTSNQSITSTATLARGELPNVIVNKTGGTATFSGIVSLFGNWTYTAGLTDYAANSATIGFTNRNQSVSGVHTFENVRVHFAAGGDWDINNDITISGLFTLSGTQRTDIDGPGVVNCEGNISVSNTSNGNAGNGTINISGNANQNVTSTATLARGELPNVIINKTGGTATFTGILSIIRDWTYTAGITDYAINNATIGFTSLNQTVSGVQTFENVRVHFAGGGDWDINDDITISGLFTLSSTQRTDIDGPGVVNCEGNIFVSNTSNGNAGNGTINISGNSNQTVTSTATLARGELPNVIINKTGGTATFVGILSLIRDWTYTAGTVDYATNNATIGFTLLNQAVNGVQTFENVRVHFAGGGDWDINDDITIEGQWTLSSNQRTDIDGPGVVNCEGNIFVSNTSNGNAGNGTINITGNANQTITSTATLARGELPNVIINKTGGTATFVGILSLIRDWTYIAGTTDYASNNAMIGFTLLNQSVNGVQTFENVRVHYAGAGDWDVNDDITIEGQWTLSSNQRTDIDGPGIVNCEGNIFISNTSTGNTGNGTINITGTANQTITSTATLARGELPNVIIDKTGGTLELTGILSFNINWTYTQGTVDFTSNSTTVGSFGNGTQIDGENTSSATMQFHNLQLNTITVNQTLTGNLEVSNVLDLNQTRLVMNGNELTLNNPTSGAIIRQGNGRLRAEATNNSAMVNWNIGTDASNHIIPFGNTANTLMPFEFEVTDGGDVGMLSVTTYPTAANNTPYPVTPDAVTNMVGQFTADNSTNAIDRFWQIDKDGPTGIATMTFTYAQADVTGGVAGNEGQLEAQRYQTSTDTWQPALAGQTQDAAANRVTVPGVSTFSPWTLARNTNPLPVELLSFDAKLNGQAVDLEWITASEVNNQHFEVQRSIDGTRFETISYVQGAGNSSATIHYNDIDENPVNGINYYRLKQVDFDGQFEYSDIKQVMLKDIDMMIYPNPFNDVITVEAGENVEILIYAADGKQVWKGIPGNIDLGFLESGVYWLKLIQNGNVLQTETIMRTK